MLTFDHPDYFRRPIPAGPIPSPVLLIERTTGANLKRGDLIINAPQAWNESVEELAEVVSDPGTNDHLITRFVADQSSGYVTSSDDVSVVRAITFGMLSQGIPIEWLRDDSIRYYGKFDDQCSAYCYEVALDTYETAGHCDEMGWLATRVDLHLVDGTVYPLRSDPVLAQWPEITGGYPAGYIVLEDDRGAVDVTFYESVAELEEAWNNYRAEESAHHASEEDDEDA